MLLFYGVVEQGLNGCLMPMMSRVGQVRETVEILSKEGTILTERLRQRKFLLASYRTEREGASASARKISPSSWRDPVGLKIASLPSLEKSA